MYRHGDVNAYREGGQPGRGSRGPYGYDIRCHDVTTLLVLTLQGPLLVSPRSAQAVSGEGFSRIPVAIWRHHQPLSLMTHVRTCDFYE